LASDRIEEEKTNALPEMDFLQEFLNIEKPKPQEEKKSTEQ
jgi:hypothetical protein